MFKIKAFILDSNFENISAFNTLIKNYCPSIEIIYSNNSFENIKKIINSKKPDVLFTRITDDNFILFNDIISKNKIEIVQLLGVEETFSKLKTFQDLIKIEIPFKLETTLLKVNEVIKKIHSKENAKNSEREIEIPKNNKSEIKDTITIHTPDSIELIKTNTLLYCTFSNKYTIFYLVNGTKIISKKSLSSFENSLSSDFFCKIHTNFIVNINYIKKIIKKNGVSCELFSGIQLPVALEMSEDLFNLLKIKS